MTTDQEVYCQICGDTVDSKAVPRCCGPCYKALTAPGGIDYGTLARRRYTSPNFERAASLTATFPSPPTDERK